MSAGAPSIAIVAGEASGDVYGARLAERLKVAVHGVELRGIGGPRMRSAGVDLLADSSRWSAIGLSEAVKLVPRLLKHFARLRNDLESRPPDVLVLIDFGAFNVRVARSVRRLETRVLYYIPPGSWKRNATHRRLTGLTDHIVTPFPWSAETLRKEGFEADCFGHPLLDVLQEVMPRNEFCSQYGFDPGGRIIGLLPGSRTQELTHNLPALIVTAARLMEADPDLQFAVPLAFSLDAGSVADDLRQVPWVRVVTSAGGGARHGNVSRRKPPVSLAGRVQALAAKDGFVSPAVPVVISLLDGMAGEVLAHARASVVASGTATLEAAVLGCPIVIIYRGSWLTGLEYKLLGRGIEHIGMPNIILERMAFPELLQESAMPQRIAELIKGIIADGPVRERMLSDLAEVKSVLGEQGATDETVQVVMRLLGASEDE